ncbi:MAG: BamA/TamA family outer membrane protein [Ferruginibacter sp.]
MLLKTFPSILFLFILSLLFMHSSAQEVNKSGILLNISFTDKDSSFKPEGIKLERNFKVDSIAQNYIFSLPKLFNEAGYPLASIDSFSINNDTYFIKLFVGDRYKIVYLNKGNIDDAAIEETSVFKNSKGDNFKIHEVKIIQQKLLTYYENHGYPFAKISLDSIKFEKNTMFAVLKIDKSIEYKIDSIRISGNAKVNNAYIQQYLGISNGSLYSSAKLAQVDKKIADNEFVSAIQPSEIIMLGSGSILHLFLKSKKTSQVNFLVGFLPDPFNEGKIQLTGDVNLDLKNALGSGERILFKWQQLQKKSPRLNLGFNIPYILRSSFGTDFLFDLYKKDSSYLQVNGQLGIQYNISSEKTGKLFVQMQSTNLLSGAIDTNKIKLSKKLPDIIDVKSVNVGIEYYFTNTNYRFNPTKGFDIKTSILTGIKKLKPNNDIISITDPGFNFASLYDSLGKKNYQIRFKNLTVKYFSLGKLSTLKTAINSGIYLSPEIFRNELFRIGGFNILRGFDEESIYADRYLVSTAEFRYLTGLNSYLFGFVDYGITGNKIIKSSNNFIGSGIGIVLETKLGILNVSYAVGKRNDIPFNLREASKLHFGYINYF